MWHLHRAVEDVTEEELDYAKVLDVGGIHSAAGSALAGASFKSFSSSTRKEIAAILLGMLRPCSLHLAVDNAGAVT